ncbi:chloromuconate cycloisomerase [Clostridioides difficile]|uniref:mandelate racemase/muconate lactonizing enzyme family protein n=1 Tax=Clostridioides difficile TaxID=1496 RepID=UPI000D1F5B47|nr:dipeptide epimerase [Clostridioides difficile]UWD39685.1 dipeptide epimerase [Clostridioides difficile]UWD43472.1 dipeptide epimerase [Clostridioides difficile]VFF91649.1 chloromuconate cycloisomerase [Clostridioides difficile]VIF53755.1 chloromuconate cycloisomerase [Clostridioides difficile]HBE9435914.1 dipeptide epimerase [Clostridioides difficile]
MKITDIKFEKLRIKLKKPVVVSFGVIEYGESIILKIETDEGYCGFGEAAPLAAVTGEVLDNVLSVLLMFKKELIGKDPLDIETIHTIMDRIIIGNTSAKAAIDIALYDIKGKIMNVPLYKVLGGFDSKVQTDITISIDKPEKMAIEALERVKEGFRILKLKAGINPEDDIEAVKLIREAVGESIRIRIDANQGWNVNSSINTIKKLEEFNVDAIEQALPHWDLDGTAYIRNKSNIKIMIDESLHSPIDAIKAIKKNAVDTFNIKLMKSSGIYPAIKINNIAEASGVNCMLGCMLETRIGITAAANLIASKKNITEADLDSFMFCEESKSISGGFVMDGDIMNLINKPGLGIEVNL